MPDCRAVKVNHCGTIEWLGREFDNQAKAFARLTNVAVGDLAQADELYGRFDVEQRFRLLAETAGELLVERLQPGKAVGADGRARSNFKGCDCCVGLSLARVHPNLAARHTLQQRAFVLVCQYRI